VVEAKLLTPAEILVTGPESLYEWREQQRLPIPGHKYMPQFRKHNWDGHYLPGKWCERRGPDLWEFRGSRGLLGRLAATFPDITLSGHSPISNNQIEAWLSAHPTILTLRDYQQDALYQALYRRWGRVALATNAGKGAVLTLIAVCIAEHDLSVLILCDEIAVFDALQGEIAEWSGLVPDLVTSGTQLPPTGRVTLAMVPTLARRLIDEEKARTWRKWVKQHTALLLDEADKATAATWKRIIANATNSHWRIGFSGTFPSATAEPYNDLKLDELMGPILIHAKNIDLIKRKVSAKPEVFLHRCDVTPTLAHTPSDWWNKSGPAKRRSVYDRAITHNSERHRYIASLIRSDTPTALVVNRIAHGQILTSNISGAVFLDGAVDVTQRHEVLSAFQRGEIKILVVTKILDRGTNRLGHTVDLLFVSGEGSTRQTLQRIGRGLRRTGGKEFLRLVDVIDRVEIEAESTRYLQRAASYLHNAAVRRLQLYRDEGFDVQIITTQ